MLSRTAHINSYVKIVINLDLDVLSQANHEVARESNGKQTPEPLDCQINTELTLLLDT